MIKVSVSNTLDAPDIKSLKTSLREYANIITDTAVFNENNNKDDITNLLYTFLEDLYITEPEEVINFVNQKPSNKLVNTLFSQFGISRQITNAFPDMLKTKTAYLLSQLFETKGSNISFKLFNEIISEFYHHLNFYNVRVEQRKFKSKYESPTVEKKFYLENDETVLSSYNLTYDEMSVYKDPNIQFKVYSTIYKYENEVQYHIKCYPGESDTIPKDGEWKLPHGVELKLDYSDIIRLPQGTTEIKVKYKKYDIYDLIDRNANELEYLLEPVLINDPLSILDKVDSLNFRTSKYLMKTNDYFDRDIYNKSPKNVFPIITNILYIQFGTSETIDAMKFYPDLVRMFSMTATQDDMFTFKIGTSIAKVSMSEYINILSFIKLKELQFNSTVPDPNTGVVSNEWKYGDIPIVAKTFSSMVYPKDKLTEIYELLLYYKDMRHEYDVFNTFKRKLNALMNNANQIKNTKIFNINDFHIALAGNIPLTFDEFFIELEAFYPDSVNIILNKDQNKLLKEKVRFIYNTYKPATTKELFNLIAMNDEVYINLNTTVYDMLKINFIDKYPRIVQQIEAISSSTDFVELYLNNYKRMLFEVVKMDDLVTYFVNDTFKRFILDSTFKEEFFDPVLDMFQQYFFKAELSYQNSDSILHIQKDKMQQVVCGTSQGYNVILEGYSELSIRDNMNMNFNLPIKTLTTIDDNFKIVITDETTNTTQTFTTASDSGYKDYNNI